MEEFQDRHLLNGNQIFRPCLREGRRKRRPSYAIGIGQLFRRFVFPKKRMRTKLIQDELGKYARIANSYLINLHCYSESLSRKKKLFSLHNFIRA